MARWDSAEMLAAFKLYGQIPEVTTYPTDAQIYQMLSDANEEVFSLIASQAPHVLYGPPTLMVSNDNGYTYEFGDDEDGDPIFPLGHVEVAARDGGKLLFGGTYFNGSLDFVPEGNRIRMPRGVPRTFSGGPYARFVAVPPPISADSEPTLQPKQARALVVYRALIKWANIGGQKDPLAFQEEFDRIWTGDQGRGDGGLLYTLKSQYEQGNYPANPKYFADWWSWLDTIHAEAGSQE